jgi:hypothetical protein
VRSTNSSEIVDFDVADDEASISLPTGSPTTAKLPSRDAGEDPIHHRPGQRVALGEVPVRRDGQLVLVVSRPHPRPADRHASPTELGGPVVVVLALRAHDLRHLGFHQLVHDTEPDADAQRQQPLPRRADELAQRLLNLRWKRALRCLPGRDDPRRGYLLHGGSSCPRGLGWHLSRSQRERTRREGPPSKFYEISDNLLP